MSFPGGPGWGGSPGSQGNTDLYTSTITAQAQATNIPVITATPSSPYVIASSTVTASTTSNVNQGLLIGVIVGGIGGLLLFALVVGYFCTIWKRAKKQVGKSSSAEAATYTDLNAAFGGVPFSKSQQESWNERLLNTYVPGRNESRYPVTLRGGDIAPGPRTGVFEADRSKPAHHGNRGLGANPPGFTQYSDGYTSPTHYLDSPYGSSTQQYSSYNSSPEMQQYTRFEPAPINTTGPYYLPVMAPTVPSPTAASPRHTRDTMGFPFDPRNDDFRSPPQQSDEFEISPSPGKPTPIVSPRPRPHSVRQESLERAIRANLGMAQTPTPTRRMTDSPTPVPLPPKNPARVRGLSHEMFRESPILGISDPTRLKTTLQGPPMAFGKWLGRPELDRNPSTRTTNTVSTLGVDMITDEELDRLGVGPRI